MGFLEEREELRRLEDEKERAYYKMVKLWILLSVIGIFLISVLFSSFFINDAYEKSVVTRFGEINRVVGDGIHFKIPFVESNNRADTRFKEATIETQVAMRGGANVIGVSLTFNHSISKDDVVIIELYKKFGSEYDYENRLLSKLATDRAKSLIGKYTIEDFIENRNKARQDVKDRVTKDLAEFGIQIHGVQFSDISFSDKYRKVLDGVAKSRAEAAQAEQDARKEKFLAEKAITQARGLADAKKLQADAEAYRIRIESIEKAKDIERIGEANAKSIKLQNQASKNVKGLADLRRAEALKNWDGSVPQFMSGSSGNGSIFPFMNIKDFVK